MDSLEGCLLHHLLDCDVSTIKEQGKNVKSATKCLKHFN